MAYRRKETLPKETASSPFFLSTFPTFITIFAGSYGNVLSHVHLTSCALKPPQQSVFKGTGVLGLSHWYWLESPLLSCLLRLYCSAGEAPNKAGFPVGILPSPLPPLQNSCTPKILTCLCAFMCRCGLNSAPSHVHASSALKLLQNSVFVRNCFARTVEPRKHKIQIIPTSTTRKAFPMSSGCKYICWAVVFHVYCNVSEP